MIGQHETTQYHSQMALDLRGAIVRGEDLNRLPLNHMQGGLSEKVFVEATPEQRELAAIHIEQCFCAVTYLKRSELSGAYLQGSTLRRAHLERANLTAAHLESTNLNLAHLHGAKLVNAYLDGASLGEADLTEADVTGAHVDLSVLLTAHLVRTVGVPNQYLAEQAGRDTLVRLRLDLHPLTTNDVASLLSALTELHTKCWLIAQRRIAELADYSTHATPAFDDEAHLEVVRLSYESPLDVILKVAYAFGAIAVPYGLVLLAFVTAQQTQMHMSRKHAEWILNTATVMIEQCNPDLSGPEKLQAIEAMIPTVERLAHVPGNLQPLPLPVPGVMGAVNVQKKSLH